MSINDEFTTKMNDLKNQYYSKNSKNIIFKKAQKIECAKEIIQNFDMKTLYSRTFFIIPDTNRIFVDYTVLKTYAHPSIYMDAIHYYLNLILEIIAKYGNFEIHINLCTFTISAAERFKDSIFLFCSECEKHETAFAVQMTKMYVYNTPSVMENVMVFFSRVIAPVILNKVVLYSKVDSPRLMQELFTPLHIS